MQGSALDVSKLTSSVKVSFVITPPTLTPVLCRTLPNASSSAGGIVVDTSYAAQGAFRGGSEVPHVDSVISVGIICDSWPHWLFSFQHLRFKLLWVAFRESHWLELLQKIHPHIKCVCMTDDATLECPQVLAVSDGLSSLINLFSNAQMVICDWNLRTPRNFHRWKAHHWSLSHDQCGGVSDITVKVTVLVSPLIVDSFQLQTGDTFGPAPPPSSLSGILDVKVRGADLPHEPRLEVLSTPVVKEIQPNVYHYKGLYPTSVREPEFFVPCVFSPGKWVRRSLQAFELLRVFDVPSSIEKALSHRQSKALIPFLSRPNKCLSRVIQVLFVSHTGGGFSSPESPSGAAVGSEPSATPTDLPINWNANEAHNKDERAAKSDDAEVPVHLWHNHLSTLLNMQLFGDTHIKGLNTLRKFILVVWRKSITKCFCSWIRCKGCHNDRMQKRFPGVFIYEEYNPGHSSFCISNKSYKNCVVWKDNKYSWHGKKGYQAWWKIIYSSNSSTDRSKSIEAFGECVNKAAKATEWKWDGGSRTFFWRWGENWRSSRDGAKVHVQNKLPNCRDKQFVPKDDNVKLKMKEKLSDVRSKGYIRGGGEVKSLTSFFAVPKSDDDIRMVYNGTSSGLNDAVWAPWFALPTVDTHMRSTVPGTYMCDIDLSEMFLNFMLDEDIRPYAGVDFSKFFADEIKEGNFTLWEMWVRLLMGFKPSPYLSTRDMRRIEEFLTGDRNNPTNPFRWSKVVFNLPGSKNYNPSLPRVYRIRIEGTIAGDLFIYIDDLRVTCPTRKECWEGAHQVCCRLTWLGLQDAPRKRSEVSMVPRAWAGSIVHTDNDVVTVLIAEKKWNKAKGWIQWLASCLDVSNKLNHKELEKCRGFLIYVSRTYKSMRPYLRGLHMTIENWRSNRDDEGWKLINIMKKIDVDQDSEIPNFVNATKDIKTEFVKAVPRLHDDVKMLSKLTRTEAPPKVRRRRSKVGKAYYGFGDASGSGFGYAVQIEKIIYDEYGEWNSCICEKSSNYRELRNLVNAVKRMCSEGLMTDVELYLFTDNYVAERAYYNGGSSNSRDLDDLVFQLWDIQMHYDFDLFLYHVAGTRMIECGVDGLSRGDKGEGIARGIPVIDFVPIHLSPMERSSQLENWIYTWWKDSEELGELRKMEPIDWFTNYNKRGAFLWDVAPAAGESAVEQLSAHIHAQPYADHIFLIPRLCTSHYRKQLLKACDVVITLKPAECVYWPTNMHEPLLFGIYFSLLPHSRRYAPWKLKYTKWLEFERCNLQEMQAEGQSLDGSCLRKLFELSRKIPSMPQRMARKMLSTEKFG